MKLSTRTVVILAVGAGLLWWWYRSRAGLSLVPSFMGGSQPLALPQGTGVRVPPAASLPPVSSLGISDPAIVAARGAATGPESRKAPHSGMRWINTVTPPYYGFWVTQAQFNDWSRLPGDVQGHATTDIVAAFAAQQG